MVLAIILGLNVFMAVLITVVFNKIHTLHSEIKDLKYSLKKELKIKKYELDQYKLTVQTIEKFVNMPEGKRLGLYSNVDNETLGILSRCGFAIRVIYDLEIDKNHIEVYKIKQVDTAQV